MKILLIEDDPVWMLKLKMLVENVGQNNVFMASTIADTQELLHDLQPDVIVADICLPDGRTTSFFESIHADYPIIFLTNYAQDDFLESSLCLPKSTFIVKPFHELTLIAQIKKLEKQQQDKEDTKHIKVFGKYRQHISVLLKDIVFMEAEGNYISISTNERSYVMKNSLRKLLPSLDERFIQLQKSIIVNTKFINRFDAHLSCVILRDNKHFTVGRIYKKKLVQKLEK